MTRLLVCVTALLLTAPSLPARQQNPVFRAGTELVTLDVRVLDAEGRPVTGLTPDDFAVELDGRKQVVRVVDYLEYAGAGVVPELTDGTGPVPGTRGVPLKPGQLTGRAVMLAIDDLSFRGVDVQTFTGTARQLVASLGGNDSVGISTTSGQGPATGISRDKTRALLALNTVVGRKIDLAQEASGQRMFAGVASGTEVVVSSSEALGIQSGSDASFGEATQRICGRRSSLSNPAAGGACAIAVRVEAIQQSASLERRFSSQIDELRGMIDVLRLEPPPRIMLLMSGGIDIDNDHANRIDPLRSAALAAGVQIHVLSPNLTSGTDAGDRSANRSRVRRENEDFSHRGLDLLAGVVNADVYRVLGGATRVIDRTLLGWSGSYRVGVEPPTSLPRSGLVPVTVTVRRQGVTVRTAKSVLVRTMRPTAPAAAASDAPATPPSSEASLARLVDAGGTASEVPMTIGATSKRDEAGRDVQLVTVEVPGSVMGPLSALFAATDDANRVIQRGTLTFAQPPAGEDYRVSLLVPIAPGPFRLRVAVADAAGALGSVEQNGVARVGRLRSSSVSDLLLSWVGDDGKARMVALETIPAPARTLQVALEFYSTADPAGTNVRIAILNEASGDVLAASTPVPMKTLTGWRVGVGIPVSSLSKGVFVVRATIKEGTDAPLTLSRTVRTSAR